MRIIAYFAATALALLPACSGGSSRAQAGKSSANSASSAWFDPARHLPEIRPPGYREQELKTAVQNQRAPLIAITNATIMTAAGSTLENATIVTRGGKIESIGSNVAVPSGARIIDGKNRFVTPGIIDTHSHIGVYPSPYVEAQADGNEMTGPVTAHARAAYGYSPQDPAITRARAGGVTTALILPGSANLIGGQGFTAVMSPGRSSHEVAFPGAPATIKMACGENPKRVYGAKGGPQTRMGLYAHFRSTFHQAAEYDAKLKAYENKHEAWLKKRKQPASKSNKPEPGPEAPSRDLGLETLAAVLRGEILVQIHCYRAPEMRELIEISKEFGFSIRSFHHALEAYKIRDLLATNKIAVSTWADWWGFKMEAFDAIPQNAALVSEAGGRTVIHSDSSIGIQRLNQEAAKALASGRHAGIELSDDEALRWITANPAWVLGIDSVTGTLEVGKRADVVLWSGSPFSVYSKADVVMQAGEIGYQRERGLMPTDFELGNSALSSEGGAK